MAALTLHLATIPALFRKLEREQYRAYHHRSLLHKADHFFNFCVTAHSLRDYYLEHAGAIAPAKQQLLHDKWNKEPVLVAVRDIANSTKHFQLRDRGPARTPQFAPTKRVIRLQRTMVGVYRNSSGFLTTAIEQAADLSVTTSAGDVFRLYEFTTSVIAFWREFLTTNQIPLRRQSFTSLSGA